MLIATLVLALQAPVPAPSPSPAAKPSPEARRDTEGTAAPANKGLRKYVKGTLGGIDVDNKTVRFVDEAGNSKVWPVNERLLATSPARAEEMAKALTPGLPVVVVYDEQDGHQVVVDIRPQVARKSKDVED